MNPITKTAAVGPSDQRLVRKRVSSLIPSLENEHVYRATSEDPGIVALAAAIKRNGCVPLVVTQDLHIVSGHRRHRALLLNGQKNVSCIVLPHNRDYWTEDEYVKLLVDHNESREKSVAEKVREELVNISAKDAYKRLTNKRLKSLYAPEFNDIEAVTLGQRNPRHAISPDKSEHTRLIKHIVFEERKDFWPLSSRAIHYALLNYNFVRGYYWPRKTEPDHGTRRELKYANDDGSYDATCDLVMRLRLLGEVPWAALDDATRQFKEFYSYQNVRDYIRSELDCLFDNYRRDLMQSQPNYIAVVVEKNTIYPMVLRVTEEFQIPTLSARGFAGIDMWHDVYVKFRASGKERLILIVLTDHDPEGLRISTSAGETLRDDFGVIDPQIIRAGVTREQIKKYNLPEMNFAKETSANFDWFCEINGGDTSVFELEALRPQDMLKDLRHVILKVIDVELFRNERSIEQQESVYLESCHKTAVDSLKSIGS